MPVGSVGAPSQASSGLEAIFDRRKEFIRERRARRYNRQVGEIMSAWINVLTDGQRTKIRTFNLGAGEGIDSITVLDGTAATSLPLLGRRGPQG